MPTINQLKIRQAQTLATPITQMKTLAEIGMIAPEQLPRMVTRMWSDSYGPVLSTLIDKYAHTMTFTTENDYTWKIQGSSYRNIPVIEVRDSAGNPINSSYASTMVGANGEMVQFVFDKAYFGDGTQILGQHNEMYPFRVIGDGYAEGSNWVVNAVLMGNAYDGCPKEDLYPGMRFSRSYAPVENQLSRRVGNIVTSTPTEMRNGWTTIRKDKKFTGAADVQQKLCCTIPVKTLDANNNVLTKNTDVWFNYEEWVFWNEWYKEKNEAEMYSRDNRTASGQYVDFGKSGNVIRKGNGIMPQLESGRTVYYSGDFNINDFVDYLNNIFTNGNIPISERKVVVLTGTQGMTMASRAINQTTSGFIPMSSGVIRNNVEIDAVALGLVKKNSDNTLTYNEGQYTKYIGPNGFEVEFVLDMSFDDPVRNKIMAADGRGPLSSRAFRVIDMGSSTEPNIYRCKLEGSQYSDSARYMLGMRNPWGIKSNIISSDEDASSVHTMTSLGACILDPTRCLNYLPAGLVA